MNQLTDVDRAWKFVRGFDVPALTDDDCDDWRNLIAALSVGQFQEGCRKTRARRQDQLHLRPAIEAFKGYAGFGTGDPSARVETPDTAIVRRLAQDRAPRVPGDRAAFVAQLKRDNGIPLNDADEAALAAVESEVAS